MPPLPPPSRGRESASELQRDAKTPAERSWLQPATTLTALAGIPLAGAAAGSATAAIFTLIAFQFSLGRILPPISCLTRADLFALGSSVLVYLALAETILSGKLNVGGKLGLARRIDRHARWVYATLFVVVVVVTLGL